jgi:DNA-binding transcriptional MerR regulator
MIMQNKAATAYKTIGEVSEALDVPTHVLRFWEKKFKQISPYKNNGRRYYTPEDIDIIQNIKFLLYTKGLTIPGVIKHLSESPKSVKTSTSAITSQALPEDAIAAITNIIKAIKHIKSQLKEAIGEDC